MQIKWILRAARRQTAKTLLNHLTQSSLRKKKWKYMMPIYVSTPFLPS